MDTLFGAYYRARMGRLRVLVVTNLFPSNAAPGYAPFNRQQFAALSKLAEVEVLAVVPWRLGRSYSGPSKDVVREEWIDGLHVLHPRFASIPGVPSLNASLLAGALAPRLVRERGRFDVILGSYAYPDGCAAVLLGRLVKRPVVVKCHGSDLNRVPEDRAARVQLTRLLPRADAVVTVSEKLGETAIDLGVSPRKISVVYNGIDRKRFSVRDKAEARARVGLPLEAEVVVYVGHLAEHKGTRDLLDAIPRVAERRSPLIVAFVGDGPMAQQVAFRAEHGGVEQGRVIPVGRVRHDEVADWISAADVLTLPSWDEGMPNVVREAHAVGRPVVATRVGGIPEAIFDPVLGRLVPPRDPAALAAALIEVLAERPASPEIIAARAVTPSWEESASALLSVLERVA